MTHHEILQVSPSASPEIIKKAYRTLARKYHPDIFREDEKYAESKMKQINEAYRVLSSPELRQRYDNFLERQKKQTNQPKQTTHTYQTYHQPQRQKTATVSKKCEIPGFLGVLLVVVIPLGVALLIILLSLRMSNNEIPQSSTHLFESETSLVEPTTPSVKVVTSSTQATTPSTEPTVSPAKIIPRSGEILSGIECYDGSKLTISASSGSSCVVKLKTSSGVDRLSFYVRAGDIVTVGVPAEYLYVYFASGDTWYGEELLFGDETRYSKDKELLDFTRYEWQYTLYPVMSGNFTETLIDSDEF